MNTNGNEIKVNTNKYIKNRCSHEKLINTNDKTVYVKEHKEKKKQCEIMVHYFGTSVKISNKKTTSIMRPSQIKK